MGFFLFKCSVRATIEAITTSDRVIAEGSGTGCGGTSTELIARLLLSAGLGPRAYTVPLDSIIPTPVVVLNPVVDEPVYSILFTHK